MSLSKPIRPLLDGTGERVKGDAIVFSPPARFTVTITPRSVYIQNWGGPTYVLCHDLGDVIAVNAPWHSLCESFMYVPKAAIRRFMEIDAATVTAIWAEVYGRLTKLPPRPAFHSDPRSVALLILSWQWTMHLHMLRVLSTYAGVEEMIKWSRDFIESDSAIKLADIYQTMVSRYTDHVYERMVKATDDPELPPVPPRILKNLARDVVRRELLLPVAYETVLPHWVAMTEMDELFPDADKWTLELDSGELQQMYTALQTHIKGCKVVAMPLKVGGEVQKASSPEYDGEFRRPFPYEKRPVRLTIRPADSTTDTPPAAQTGSWQPPPRAQSSKPSSDEAAKTAPKAATTVLPKLAKEQLAADQVRMREKNNAEQRLREQKQQQKEALIEERRLQREQARQLENKRREEAKKHKATNKKRRLEAKLLARAQADTGSEPQKTSGKGINAEAAKPKDSPPVKGASKKDKSAAKDNPKTRVPLQAGSQKDGGSLQVGKAASSSVDSRKHGDSCQKKVEKKPTKAGLPKEEENKPTKAVLSKEKKAKSGDSDAIEKQPTKTGLSEEKKATTGYSDVNEKQPTKSNISKEKKTTTGNSNRIRKQPTKSDISKEKNPTTCDDVIEKQPTKADPFKEKKPTIVLHHDGEKQPTKSDIAKEKQSTIGDSDVTEKQPRKAGLTQEKPTTGDSDGIQKQPTKSDISKENRPTIDRNRVKKSTIGNLSKEALNSKVASHVQDEYWFHEDPALPDTDTDWPTDEPIAFDSQMSPPQAAQMKDLVPVENVQPAQPQASLRNKDKMPATSVWERKQPAKPAISVSRAKLRPNVPSRCSCVRKSVTFSSLATPEDAPKTDIFSVQNGYYVKSNESGQYTKDFPVVSEHAAAKEQPSFRPNLAPSTYPGTFSSSATPEVAPKTDVFSGQNGYYVKRNETGQYAKYFPVVSEHAASKEQPSFRPKLAPSTYPGTMVRILTGEQLLNAKRAQTRIRSTQPMVQTSSKKPSNRVQLSRQIASQLPGRYMSAAERPQAENTSRSSVQGPQEVPIRASNTWPEGGGMGVNVNNMAATSAQRRQEVPIRSFETWPEGGAMGFDGKNMTAGLNPSGLGASTEALSGGAEARWHNSWSLMLDEPDESTRLGPLDGQLQPDNQWSYPGSLSQILWQLRQRHRQGGLDPFSVFSS